MRGMLRRVAFALILLGAARPAHAEPNARFGGVVDLDGDRLVVAADGANTDVFNGGRVHVFTAGADGWQRTAELGPDEPVPFARFGAQLAIRGDTVVVGAPVDYDSQGFAHRGHGYVFEYDGDAWTQRMLVSTGEHADDLGAAVALGSERAAFAATQRTVGTSARFGLVIVVGRDGGEWREQARIEAPDAERFGDALAMDDDHLVVSGLDGLYPYTRDGDAWVADTPVLLADTYVAGMRLDGASLLAVGYDRVVFLARTGATWAISTQLEFDSDAHPLYSASPGLRGDLAAVGFVHEVVDGSSRVVQLFTRDDNGAWSVADAVAAATTEGYNWSYADVVALSDEWLAVGEPEAGPQDDPRSGKVHMFAAPGWTPAAVMTADDLLAPASGYGCDAGGGSSYNCMFAALLLRRRRRR